MHPQQSGRELTAQAYAQQLANQKTRSSVDSTLDTIFIKTVQSELDHFITLSPLNLAAENFASFIQKVLVLEQYQDKLAPHSIAHRLLAELQHIEADDSEKNMHLRWELYVARECAQVEDFNQKIRNILNEGKQVDFKFNILLDARLAVDSFKDALEHEENLSPNHSKLKLLKDHCNTGETLIKQYAESYLKVLFNKIDTRVEILNTMLQKTKGINSDTIDRAHQNITAIEKLNDELKNLEKFLTNASKQQAIQEKILEGQAICHKAQSSFTLPAAKPIIHQAQNPPHSGATSTSKRKSLSDDDI